MADNAKIRLNKVLRELNISLDRAVDYLNSKGHDVDARPTTKISDEVYQVLLDEFQTDKSKKVASKEVGEEKRKEKEAIRIQLEQEQEERRLVREKRNADAEEKRLVGKVDLAGPKTVGKIDLSPKKKAAATKPVKEVEEVKEPVAEPKVEKPVVEEVKKEVATETKDDAEAKTEGADEKETLETKYKKLSGPKITGDKIDLSKFQKPKRRKTTLNPVMVLIVKSEEEESLARTLLVQGKPLEELVEIEKEEAGVSQL